MQIPILISSRIFLQKVVQKIEQKNAQQAHMTINQYLITKGTETIDVFRRIHLSEEAGTGIPKISQNWHELGYRSPQIKNDKINKFLAVTLPKEPLMTLMKQMTMTILMYRSLLN